MQASEFLTYFKRICTYCNQHGLEFLFRTNHKHRNKSSVKGLDSKYYIHIYAINADIMKNFEKYCDDLEECVTEAYQWILYLQEKELEE